MEFEWDPRKNKINIEKHGLAFEDAYLILKGFRVVFESPQNGEQRWGAIGLLNEKYVVVFYTKRDQVYRIISMRRARSDEKRKYCQIFP